MYSESEKNAADVVSAADLTSASAGQWKDDMDVDVVAGCGWLRLN